MIHFREGSSRGVCVVRGLDRADDLPHFLHHRVVLRLHRGKDVVLVGDVGLGLVEEDGQEVVRLRDGLVRHRKDPRDAVGAFGEVFLRGREGDGALIADHLHVAADVAGVPAGVLRRALAKKPLLGVAVLVGLLVGVEDVDDVLAHRVPEPGGEGGEFGLHDAVALPSVEAPVFCSAPWFCPERPVLEVVDERAARVNDDALAVPDFRGFDVVENFFIVLADDGELPVVGSHAVNAVLEVNEDRIGRGQGEGRLADAGGAVDDHGKLLVREGHLLRLFDHGGDLLLKMYFYSTKE